jgi:hypothetical protein
VLSFNDKKKIILFQDDSCSDDIDVNEEIMQRLYAAASRARLVQRPKRQGSPGAGPSEMFVFNTSLHVSGVQPTLTTSPADSSSPTSGQPSIVDNHPEVARNISRPETDVPYRPRYWLSMTFLSIIKQSNWQTGNSYLDRSSFLECLF